MKKLLVYLVATMFMAASAYAEKRLGVSLAYTMFDSSGTEETKSSGEKNSGSVEEDVIVPALFFEVANDNGLALGLDFTPVNQEIGSGTGDDDDAETSGANKASAELTGHYTAYVLIPVKAAYIKAGVAHASIDTTENLATGTEYGNADVNGILFGIGFERERDNGGFFRMEGTYTDYEDVTFNGALDGDSVRNVIDADVDALAIRISVGKAF